jgi:hypothetical protein
LLVALAPSSSDKEITPVMDVLQCDARPSTFGSRCGKMALER